MFLSVFWLSMYVDVGGSRLILGGQIVSLIGITAVLGAGLFRMRRWAAIAGVALTVAQAWYWMRGQDEVAICAGVPLLLQLILLCFAALTPLPKLPYSSKPAARRMPRVAWVLIVAGGLLALTGGGLAGTGWLENRAAQLIADDHWRLVAGDGFVAEFPGEARVEDLWRGRRQWLFEDRRYRFEVSTYPLLTGPHDSLPQSQEGLEAWTGELRWKLGPSHDVPIEGGIARRYELSRWGGGKAGQLLAVNRSRRLWVVTATTSSQRRDEYGERFIQSFRLDP